MIRILGADLTMRPSRYFGFGMMVYFVTGIALSWLYFLLLQWCQFDSIAGSMGFAAFVGVSQGFLLMHFYIEGLGSRHPIGLYKRYWIPTSFAHLFGHIGYGLSIGSMISAYFLYGLRGFLIALMINAGLSAAIVLTAKYKT